MLAWQSVLGGVQWWSSSKQQTTEMIVVLWDSCDWDHDDRIMQPQTWADCTIVTIITMTMLGLSRSVMSTLDCWQPGDCPVLSKKPVRPFMRHWATPTTSLWCQGLVGLAQTIHNPPTTTLVTSPSKKDVLQLVVGWYIENSTFQPKYVSRYWQLLGKNWRFA